jgi:D-sedoheptulose 7-phosphate isomerase
MMEEVFKKAFADSARISADFYEKNRVVLAEVVNRLIDTFRKDRKLMLFGNGGSAADAQHLAAEFVNRFRFDRQALPAIALTTDTSVLTCISNDSSFDKVFSRQVEAIGTAGDMVFALSTSGNSPNILEGVAASRRRGIATVCFTGAAGERLSRECDYALVVPSADTPRVQECHILAGHVIAELVERELAVT